jgi:hypothetical protein
MELNSKKLVIDGLLLEDLFTIAITNQTKAYIKLQQ